MSASISIVKLQALATEIKLRASVSAQQMDAATQAVLIHAATQYVELRRTILAGALDAATQVVLLKADTIVGYFLKVVRQNDSVELTDVQIRAFSKYVTEALAAIDRAALTTSKPFSESLRIAETKVLTLSKVKNESLATAETHYRYFAKPISLEQFTAFDLSQVVFNKQPTDPTNVAEGPYQSQTYVDITYFAQDYSLTGIPIKTLGKSLNETVYATDDFYGVANIDDDQNIFMGKTISDVAYASELLTRAITRPGVIDSATASDYAQRATVKSVTDVFGSADAKTVITGKNLTDSLQSGDTMAKLLSRSGVVDTANTLETKQFSVTKTFADAVASSEIVVRYVNRALVDSAAMSDTALRQFNKGLTDSKATSDSGTLFWVNYCDSSYFAQDYVGTTSTF